VQAVTEVSKQVATIVTAMPIRTLDHATTVTLDLLDLDSVTAASASASRCERARTRPARGLADRGSSIGLVAGAGVLTRW
jgi:hypothetical protein